MKEIEGNHLLAIELFIKISEVFWSLAGRIIDYNNYSRIDKFC